MKNYLIIGFILLCSSVQSQQYFNLAYDGLGNSDNGWNVLTVDSGYIVNDYAIDSAGLQQVRLSFISSDGQYQWSNAIGANYRSWYSGWPGSFKKDYDGGFILAGSYEDTSLVNYAHLIKYDSNCDTLWTKTYGDSINFYAGWTVTPTLDNGYLLAGTFTNVDNSDAFFIKTDSIGNQVWRKDFGGIKNEGLYSVIESSDGYYYALGETKSQGGTDGDAIVWKLDNFGNTVWEEVYDLSNEDCALNIIELQDGNLVFCGCEGASVVSGVPSITKINKDDGSIIWYETYDTIHGNTGLFKIIELADGSLVSSGQKGNVGTILKVNASGELIWYREHTHYPLGSGLNRIRSIDIASDGGFICAGVTSPYDTALGNQDVWVLKVDAFGCDTSGCELVGLGETLLPIPMIEASPNPADQQTTLVLNEFVQGNIHVYSLNGKLVHSATFEDSTYQLHTQEWDDGIYLIQLVLEDGRRLQKKLLVQH